MKVIQAFYAPIDIIFLTYLSLSVLNYIFTLFAYW